MASLGQLVVNLEANIARFTSDMQRASQQTEQAMQRMNAAADKVKNILGAVGVALSVDVLVGEINRSLDSLAALDDMAQKTGSSVETLSKLSKVAAFTGTDLGAVDGMLVKLSKNLNDVDEQGNKTAMALAAIGISTDDLKGKDPSQVFVQITNKLQDYEDGAGKVALVTDLMGKSAADMLPYMNDVAESLEDFSADSAKAAADAAAFQDGLGRLKVKYEELKIGILGEALPAMNDFIGALQATKRESDKLTNDTSITTWADDVALVLARMADGGIMVARTFNVVGESIKGAAANVELMKAIEENVNPVGAAKVLLAGGNPTTNIQAAFDKRNAIVAAAYQDMSKLWTEAPDARERDMRARIAGRSDAAYMAGVDGVAGLAVPIAPQREALSYGGGKTAPNGGKPDPTRFANQDDSWSRAGAAARMIDLANDETLAMRGTIDVTNDLIEADMRRFEEKMRAAEQITAGAENIRLSLMTDAEAEQAFHDGRIAQLQAFSALKLENEMSANALIEAETARHVQAKADMERMHQLQVLGMAGNSADQLYNIMEQAGLEQTALGKALFVANKAIAVAEIIMNTELAAAKALAMGPIVGPPLAAIVRGMGYASAGIVIGTTIASAEGGYDIPAGVNPVTQLHEKEMVLPKAQAEVIRSLANNGGGRAGAVTVNYSPNIQIDGSTDMAKNQKMIALAVQQGNADLVDKLQRAGRI